VPPVGILPFFGRHPIQEVKFSSFWRFIATFAQFSIFRTRHTPVQQAGRNLPAPGGAFMARNPNRPSAPCRRPIFPLSHKGFPSRHPLGWDRVPDRLVPNSWGLGRSHPVSHPV